MDRPRTSRDPFHSQAREQWELSQFRSRFFYYACTGANSNGTLFSLGHNLTGGGAFYSGVGNFLPTTITFTAIPGAFADCSSAAPCNFDLGFVSMQGTSHVAVLRLISQGCDEQRRIQIKRQ